MENIMIRKTYADIPAVPMDKPGFQGMTARFALTREDGMPNYALRIMEFAPGGHTSLHSHGEEHEFYFIEGEPAIADADGNETRLAVGDVVYVSPHEIHQIRNVGAGVMRMVCTIPILEGGDGKVTTPQSGEKY
jgi:quercetin dioxygenase-like cupin family protein